MNQEPYIVRSKRQATCPIPDCSVGEYIKQAIDRMSPDKIILVDANTDLKVTKEQLDCQANQIACDLIELGVNPDDTLVFYADNCVEYFIAYLSMVYLGLTTSPIKSSSGPYETGQQISQLNGKILFVSRSKLPVIRQLMNDDQFGGPLIASLKLLIVLDDKEEENEVIQELNKHRNSPKMVTTFQELINTGTGKQLENIPHFPIENPETHPFIVVFTSGTTGEPKGAIRSHRSIIATIESTKYSFAYPLTYGTSVGFVFPFGHVSGTAFLLIFLTQNMTNILFSNYSDDLYLKAIEHYRIELVPVFPTLCRKLNETDYTRLYDLSSINMMLIGGMKYPKNQVETLAIRYRVPIYEQYGATEFQRSVSNPVGKFPYGSLGTPSPNVELKIVDLKTGKNQPSNCIGEICLRGPNCFSGYLNNPEATAETIDQNGWYHSGDVGYCDSEGRLYFTDRIKELILFRHWSVSPVELEQFLHTHRSVLEVCVVGVPHQTERFHLRAYVQLIDDGKSVSKQELIDYVRENMAYEKRLNGGVQFVSNIPRTSVGKIDRAYFRNLVKDELLTELASVD